MIKTVDQKELKARIEIAQAGYKDKKAGIDFFAETDPVSGRPIAKHAEGGTVVFQCSTPLDILPTYLDQIEKGFQVHPLSVVQIDHARFDIYFYQPQSVIAAALDKISVDVTAEYNKEVDAHNAAFIESEVQAQLSIEARRRERELAEAAAKRRAEIEAEVRATYTPQPATEAAKTTPARGKR
jgi:hypothetical protein